MKCDVHVHVVNNLCKSFGILFGCPNSECSIKTLHWFKINIPTIRYLIIQVPTIFCFVKYAFDCLCFLKFSLCLRFNSYRIKVFTESVLFVVLPNFLLYIFIVGMFPVKSIINVLTCKQGLWEMTYLRSWVNIAWALFDVNKSHRKLFMIFSQAFFKTYPI